MLLTLEINGFSDAFIMSIIAIAIVFVILELIVLTINLTSYLTSKFPKSDESQNAVYDTVKEESFSMENIKDDDMMAAALVATIEYHNEIKKDVNLSEVIDKLVQKIK